jgi:hypothetical protein
MTLSVAGGITTRSVGTIKYRCAHQVTQIYGTGFSRESISRHTAKPRAPANL